MDFQPEIRLGHCSDQILGTSPVVSGKGPVLWLCRKEFLQRQKVVKQVFFEEKEYNMCGETPGQTQGEILELPLRGSLNHLHGAFLLVFIWPVILICLAYNPWLVYLRILSCVCSRQDGFYPSWPKSFG